MNEFNVSVKSESFYPPDHYGAPVVLIDDVKLEPKTLCTQMSVQAPMHVLKDIASKELAKAIIESMNHTSVSNNNTNTYYERFSFTYAGKDEIDFLKQQLKNRTEQYLKQYEINLDNQRTISSLIQKNINFRKQISSLYYGILGLSLLLLFSSITISSLIERLP
jgi:hypothetical protein